MPGGFARIGHSDASADISMQQGGAVSDVWVIADRPAAEETLLPASDPGPQRRQMVALPSRAADDLLWLGRYSERAERKIRLLRAYHLRLAETGRADLPLTEYLAEYLDLAGLDAAVPLPDTVSSHAPAARAARMLRSRNRPARGPTPAVRGGVGGERREHGVSG